jgi:hypothetical protein
MARTILVVEDDVPGFRRIRNAGQGTLPGARVIDVLVVVSSEIKRSSKARIRAVDGSG